MLDGADALILQLPLTKIDLGRLVVVGDFGKVLLDYIRVASAETTPEKV